MDIWDVELHHLQNFSEAEVGSTTHQGFIKW